MVPITTSLNSQQDEVLTHITFDTANTTANCKMIIEERIKKILDDQYKPTPTLWTNKEYFLPVFNHNNLFHDIMCNLSQAKTKLRTPQTRPA